MFLSVGAGIQSVLQVARRLFGLGAPCVGSLAFGLALFQDVVHKFLGIRVMRAAAHGARLVFGQRHPQQPDVLGGKLARRLQPFVAFFGVGAGLCQSVLRGVEFFPDGVDAFASD